MGKRYQVVIVGGGPVGAALAVDLGLRGISCAVIERQTELHRIPKGQNLTQRSMEHFARWGLVEELRAERIMPRDYPESGVVAYGSLTTDYWYAPQNRELLNPYYSEKNERLPQYLMEKVLRRKLAALPDVDTRYGWRGTNIEQDGDTVHLTITPHAGGAREILEADYVVGCDGSGSLVREQVGITRSGADFNQLMVLAVFRSRALNEGLKRFPPRSTYRVMHRDLNGFWQFFGRIDDEDGWFFHAPVLPDTTRETYDFHGLVQKVAGFEFACDFDHVGFWDLRVAVADSYRAGRVFIAGDAAHSHPPYGGFGLNNGLEDSVNLGWKLAARLDGWGGDALLRSYGEERHPVFRETGDDFITARIERDRDFFQRHNPDLDPDDFVRAWKEHAATAPGMILTYEPNYEGSRVVAGPPGGVSSAHGEHDFTARAGHHLPPHPLSDGRNTFEALGPGFTLLAFDTEDDAVRSFEQAAGVLNIPLTVIRDSYSGKRKEYGASLILVRPDQYVVWTGTGPPGDAMSLMGKAVGRT